MTGDFQHFIPRHVLRGFQALNPGGPKSVWVYKPGEEAVLEKIAEIAADTHFYSKPEAGALTLDDTITKYENRLALLIKALRKAPVGPFADKTPPAEVIAHLTLRSDNTRAGMAYAAKQMALEAFAMVGEKDSLRRLMGLAGDTPSGAISDLAKKIMAEHAPQIRKAGLSEAAVERMVFGLAKENFGKIFAEGSAMGQMVLAQLHGQADTLVSNAQKKALGQGLVSQVRMERLTSLRWEVIEGIEPNLLSDSVAIALDAKGEAGPLSFMGSDDLVTVVMPLNPKRLLVGRAEGAPPYDPVLYNLQAIASSEKFLVGSTKVEFHEGASQFIGVRIKTIISAEMAKALGNFGVKTISAKAAEPPLPPPTGDFNVTIHFDADPGEEERPRYAAIVKAACAWAAKEIQLDRISDLTLTHDVPVSSSAINRGFVPSGPHPVPAGTVAKAVTVLNGDIVETHIVIEMRIVEGLLADDQERFSASMYVLSKMLAEGWVTGEFDKVLPGVLLRPHTNQFDGLRYEQVSSAWTNYFSSRFSAKFAPDMREARATLLVDALAKAKSHIPLSRLEYRFHGDLDRFLREVMPLVESVLGHAAALAGHADSDGLELSGNANIVAAFTDLNLMTWLESYIEELRALWDQRGKWPSLDQFLALGRNVERFLWPFGVMMARAEDGSARLEIPVASDRAVLVKETLKRPLWMAKRVALKATTSLTGLHSVLNFSGRSTENTASITEQDQ